MNKDTLNPGGGASEPKAFGLYLHIPFCQSRCRYCDFYTLPAHRAVPEDYVDALLRDHALFCPKEEGGELRHPSTLYFGGGTPGLLSPSQVAKLVEMTNPLPEAEITLEVNPGAATAEKLAGFRAAGVNRLSVGVQTARPESLRRLGRIHSAADARETLQAARAAGFENLCADLMLALPGYSGAELLETIELLDAAGAHHVSAYLIKLEPGTPMGKNPPGDLPDDDQQAEFYLRAVEELGARGYHQYEISNFAKPGFEGRHNLLYWDCRDYLGLGPAAHSSLGGRRFSFPANLAAHLEAAPRPQEEGPLTRADYLMLRLRLTVGVVFDDFTRRFAGAFTAGQRALMARLAASGLARLDDNAFALTPRGMLVLNEILARLLPD